MQKNPARPNLPGPANEPVFKRIAVLSTAIGFAAALGSEACLKHSVERGIDFHWRWIALFWMAVGVAGAIYLWRLVWLIQTDASARTGPRLVRYGAILLIATVAVFAYPMRFIPNEKLGDALTGLSFAVLVLTFVGWMIYRVIRGLLHADRISESQRQAAPAASASDDERA